jgi:hypothetical protein
MSTICHQHVRPEADFETGHVPARPQRDIDERRAPPRCGPAIGGLPGGYAAIVVGSGLLMVASAFFAPLGPAIGAPVRGVVTFLTGSVGLALLLGAALRVPPTWLRGMWRRGVLHVGVLALAGVLTLGSLFGLIGMAWRVLVAPAAQSYVTDIVSLTHGEARLVLDGHNPYTSEHAYRSVLARYPRAIGTPLRGQVFGFGEDHPSPHQIESVQRAYVEDPQRVGGAFDPRTLHSYPALSFLLYVPWLWAGGQNIMLVNLLVYWILLAWLLWLVPVGWRHWGTLAALAGVSTVLASLLESNEVICIALVLLAWHLRKQQWFVAAVLLGLACAFKQYAWFFVPFFALEVVRGQGWRAVLRWAFVGLAVFLLPNLPFLLASPRAWWTSLWIPMTDPLFPVGIGIVQLSTSHLLAYAPRAFYALLELVALGVGLWIFNRWRTRIGAGALVLALLPLFFAFRSTPNYFAFAPWLALYAAGDRYREHLSSRESPVVAAAAHTLHALTAGRTDYWFLRYLSGGAQAT